MVVTIRVDASTRIGSGHVMRCLSLADELRRRGAHVEFVCRNHAGHFITHIESRGFSVSRLDAPRPGYGRADDYSSYRGVPEDLDAAETLNVVNGTRPDWLVVDHYGLGVEWETALRVGVGRIFAIDDIARPHAADMLLDQNWYGGGPAARQRYSQNVPAQCRLLLGPQYALLGPEFSQVHALVPQRDGEVRRVCVFFGGSDPGNETGRVLEALSAPDLAFLAVDVVIGANHPAEQQVESQVRARPGTVLHRSLPTLAGLFIRADLGLGAGGSTTWERACTGLPSLVLPSDRNQEAFTRVLAAEGRQIVIESSHGQVTSSDWRDAIVKLLQTPSRLSSISNAVRELTDGHGTGRVSRIMCGDDHVVSLRAPESGDGADASFNLVGEDAAGLPIADVRFTPESLDVFVADILIDDQASAETVEAAVLLETWEVWRARFRACPFLRCRSTSSTVLSVPGNPLRISILTDPDSWLAPSLNALEVEWLRAGHAVRRVYSPVDLIAGDVCFILGFSRLVDGAVRRLHSHNLVVHESNLPEGRGWAPMTWQILEGRNRICVTLFDAEDEVDAGPIHLQEWIELKGTELNPEWRAMQADVTLRLCAQWVRSYPEVLDKVRTQSGPSTFYPRRSAEDSRLDPDRPLGDQFDLLRVIDNERYPGFLDLRGRRIWLRVHG